MPMAEAFNTPRRAADTGGPWRAWLAAWREQRYVARRCRELLALADQLRRDDPGLAGLALYRRILAQTLGQDGDAVEQALRQAEDNFATWPVSRPLTLRDVAHQIAVSEYFAANVGRQEMRAELKRVVDDTIPGDL